MGLATPPITNFVSETEHLGETEQSKKGWWPVSVKYPTVLPLVLLVLLRRPHIRGYLGNK